MKPLLSDYVQRRRLQAILPFISGNVLDIGCGISPLPDQLTPEQSYVGIDKDPHFLNLYSQRYPYLELYMRDLDSEPIGLENRCFDTVIMSAVIEHLRFPENVLNEIRSLLSSEGLMLITTPSLLGDMIHKIGSHLRIFYSRRIHKHENIFGYGELLHIIEKCGYRMVKFHPFLMRMNQLVVCQPI